MTRTNKVKAYNVLALSQRRKNYSIGSQRWQECGSEMIKAMNKLDNIERQLVQQNITDTRTDWVEKLSSL